MVGTPMYTVTASSCLCGNGKAEPLSADLLTPCCTHHCSFDSSADDKQTTCMTGVEALTGCQFNVDTGLNLQQALSLARVTQQHTP